MSPTESESPDEPFYTMLYCSVAAAGVDEAELDRILAASGRNNPARGITGMLVFGGGLFLQWLEGPRDAVKALMEHIKKDTRHESIVRLHAIAGARTRMFPDWSMEKVPANDVRELLLDELGTAQNVQQAEAISLLLQLLDNHPVLSRLAPLR
jgi:Sensors of blue-light using FAD